MEKQFVPFEIADKLRTLGYDEPCLAMYNDQELNMWLQDQYDFRSVGEETGFQFKNSMWDDSRFVAAPLWQQVIDWLRSEFSIMVCIDFYNEGSGDTPEIIFHFKIAEPKTWDQCDIVVMSDFPTYEAARLKAIEEAIKLIP